MTIDGSEIEAVAPGWGLRRVVQADPRGVSVVALSGDLTRTTAAALRTGLTDVLGGGGPRLVLDLSAVRTCDTASLQAIEQAAGRALRRGGSVRLAAVPAHLREWVAGGVQLAGPTLYDHVAGAISAPWRAAVGADRRAISRETLS